MILGLLVILAAIALVVHIRRKARRPKIADGQFVFDGLTGLIFPEG